MTINKTHEYKNYKNKVERGKEVPKERKVERRGEVGNHKHNQITNLSAAVK